MKQNQAPLAVEVTNAGKLDLPVDYGQLKLEEIRYTPPQGFFGGVFFAAVTTINDRMLINFVFSEPALSRQTVSELAEKTMMILSDACRGETSDTEA